MNSQFNLLYDNGKIKCVIGTGSMAHTVKEILNNAENVSFEYAKTQNSEWFQQRQFLIGISDTDLKQQIVNYFDQYNTHYFSVVGKNNIFGDKTIVGVGTFINSYNDLLSSPTVGNHCIVTTHCQLGHDVAIGDFSHISSYCYLNNVAVKTGVVIGLGTRIIGNKNQLIVVDYCNFVVNSVVNRDILSTGTYFGNRKLSDKTSKEHKIV
jgi:acetyltransferase-like isoleucine patch superfamily enzyme